MKTLSTEQLQARLRANPGLVLLEALPEKYFSEGHLPGARHFPHERAPELAPEVVADRSAEVVVYCASSTCQNSHIAARVLQSLGYANVAVYAGGKKEWSETGLALETSRAAATVAS